MQAIYPDISDYILFARDVTGMITSAQLRAARALLGIDQRQLAEMARLSLPTIQRMEASGGQVRGIIDTLMKVVEALEGAGIELISDNAPSSGRGRGVRLREAGVRGATGIASGSVNSAPAGDAA
jgi:transcriptional regulator with XRE-family HTH domain